LVGGELAWLEIANYAGYRTIKRERQLKKLSLLQWAAVAEILGTVAVIFSLLFVAYSINRNTTELRMANDTNIYQVSDSMMADIASDPELAVLSAKRDFGLEFEQPRLAQIFFLEQRDLNQWEQAYYWHQDGLFSDRQWAGWDKAFSSDFPTSFPIEWWLAIRHYFPDDFARHVDQQYRE